MFIYCQACCGFWVGLTLAYTGHWPFTGWPVESAVAGAALGALWKEWGCQTDVWKLEKPTIDKSLEQLRLERTTPMAQRVDSSLKKQPRTT